MTFLKKMSFSGGMPLDLWGNFCMIRSVYSFGIQFLDFYGSSQEETQQRPNRYTPFPRSQDAHPADELPRMQYRRADSRRLSQMRTLYGT